MHRPLALLAAGVLLAAVATAEASAAYTIRTKDGWVHRIGALPARSATLAHAIEFFGTPSRTRPIGDGSDACRVAWRRLRLRATFADFGTGDACDPAHGRLQVATIRSRRHFRTWRGLRVGDRSSSIRRKHPRARFRRRTWWISSAISPYGEEGARIPTVEAIVSGGRVRVLRLWIGGAGD